MGEAKEGGGKRLEIAAFIMSGVAVAAFVGGFFAPPLGVVDGSVLTGIGELLGFVALFLAWHSVDKGRETTITHGQTTINIGDDD